MADHASLVLEHLSPLADKFAQGQVKERYPAGWSPSDAVPIPARFYSRARGDHPLPPLAEMVLSAKGAAAPRVRTYLWLHLLAGRGGDPVKVSTSSWVRILNLLPPTAAAAGQVAPAVERNAQRRFRRAVNHSVESGWIDRPRRGVLRLRDPWTGELWRPPSPTERSRYMAERAEATLGWGHNLVRTREYFEADPVELPVGCFANGAVGVLSGAGLATLIILLDIGADAGWQPMPHKRAVRYGLGYRPWRSGIAELHRFGWLELAPQPMAGSVPVTHYWLRLSRMRGDSHLKLGWAPAWDRIRSAKST